MGITPGTVGSKRRMRGAVIISFPCPKKKVPGGLAVRGSCGFDAGLLDRLTSDDYTFVTPTGAI
jgi:hypothetical protein